MIKHPHFERVDGLASERIYRSKATGLCYLLRRRRYLGLGIDEVVAIPVLSDGSPLPFHVEPFARGSDEWNCLDAVHARR